jgi:2,3-bisphosphoglycerate-independent phosphoglycerate mutase
MSAQDIQKEAYMEPFIDKKEPKDAPNKNATNQTALIILDGWGYRENTLHNAVAQAKTPNFDKYWATYPHTLLEASGLAVGLPEGQMGNSEIGHTTIGAGRAIDTDLVRIKKAIEADEFISNPAFVKLFEHVKAHDSTIHVQGLIGRGGVHAHTDHLIAFLRATKHAGIEKIAIHAFTDGRDTAPQSAAGFLEEIEKAIEEIGVGFIATASGRFYAMDRDNNWDRLAKAEEVIFEGRGKTHHLAGKLMKPSEYIRALHAEGILDEHLEPVIFLDENGKNYKVQQNDGIFFFNFRSDRARMLAKSIIKRASENGNENNGRNNWCFVTLTEYQKDLDCLVAFPPSLIATTLAKEISAAGLTQAHIAETEKYPHATFFLNGGVEIPYPGERHIMLDSRKDVPTHDLAPKMRAEAIADKAIEEINAGTNFIFINFANPDMVGHTANVPAIIEAIEETDLQLGRVVDAMLARTSDAYGDHGMGEKNTFGLPIVTSVFVTADHGNAEVNIDLETGDRHTAHTINPVPAIIVSETLFMPIDPAVANEKPVLRSGGTLADIASTMLDILDVKKPGEMSGRSILGM